MHLTIKQSINHFINPPIKQFQNYENPPINQLTTPSISKRKASEKKVVNQSITLSINQFFIQSIYQSINLSINHFINQSIYQSISLSID